MFEIYHERDPHPANSEGNLYFLLVFFMVLQFLQGPISHLQPKGQEKHRVKGERSLRTDWARETGHHDIRRNGLRCGESDLPTEFTRDFDSTFVKGATFLFLTTFEVSNIFGVAEWSAKELAQAWNQTTMPNKVWVKPLILFVYATMLTKNVVGSRLSVHFWCCGFKDGLITK